MKILTKKVIEITVRGCAVELDAHADSVKVLVGGFDGLVDVEGPEEAARLESLLAECGASAEEAPDDAHDVWESISVAELAEKVAELAKYKGA
jgi:hypothetical protein